MKTYGVIMAGGGGTRFWPLSRKERPKQLLNLSGRDIMVNETIDRVARSIAKEDIFIVTNASQASLMREETGGRIREDHILAEPAARNTAGCIGYAAMEIVRKYEDGIMCILPSDAFVADEEEFKRVIDAAIAAAKDTDRLVTIGIRPSFPATGYGYIKGQLDSLQAIPSYPEKNYAIVEEFVEKPDPETAQNYVDAGNYLWNSGMFIWRASTILKKFEALLPDVYDCLMQIGAVMGSKQEQDVLERIYPVIPKISIDYGIMERSSDVLVIEGDFGWNDVGSLDMLGVLRSEDESGNILWGDQVNVDTNDCIICSSDKLVATVGVKNLIIVQTADAVLVCDKNKAQDVKKVVDLLAKSGRDTLL